MTTSSSPNTSYDLLRAQQQQRRDIARLGAFAQHRKYDARETTRGAFQARMRRFEQQVDPDGALKRCDPQALARRVQAALNEEMARVRLARSKRALEKREAIERLRRTPPDHATKLERAALAIAVNIVETAQISQELTTLDELNEKAATQKRVAPVGTETTSAPKSQRRNTQKLVSSDGGADTLAHRAPRRQTSTPKSATQATGKKSEKKAANHGNSKRSKR